MDCPSHAISEDHFMQPRTIVILTSHVFLEGYRKASIHFVARAWAAAGHTVYFTTVGHSALSRFKQKSRLEALRKDQDNRYAEIENRLHAGAYLPLLHAFSTRRKLFNRLAVPLFKLYSSYLPRFVAQKIRDADLVVLESGTPIAFFDLVQRLNPSAKTLYFCRDLLHSVGASSYLSALERKAIAGFDSVCVPSRHLGTLLPPGGRVNFVPQGVDGEVFDQADVSPYEKGSRNAIVVGDMLFDHSSVTAMAAAAPNVTFHLFGIKWPGPVPANVKIHGEHDFKGLAAYMRHADIGLAPYKVTKDEVYLAESSLKLLQYAYCLLPVVLPDLIPVSRGNEVTYRLGQTDDWGTVIDTALKMPREPAYRTGIESWSEVAQRTLATVF